MRASAVAIFAALGDPSRAALVERLCAHGPASITQLASGAAITRQAVTKHLRVLETAQLVRAEKAGRETIYEFTPSRLDDARKAIDAISRHWDQAIERLRKLVED